MRVKNKWRNTFLNSAPLTCCINNSLLGKSYILNKPELSYDHVDVLMFASKFRIYKREKQMCPCVTYSWPMGTSLLSLQETISVRFLRSVLYV